MVAVIRRVEKKLDVVQHAIAENGMGGGSGSEGERRRRGGREEGAN